MKALNKEEIKNILYIEEIQYGLNNYTNALLNVDNAKISEIKEFMKEIEENIVIDYYGNIIKENEFNLLVKELSKEEEKYLKELRASEETKVIFTEIEERLLDIAIKLSYEEILFSSFYLGKKITIWGNFNKEFVMFFEKDIDIEEIKILAKKYNLEIKDIREVR
ncbi:MAG: hypothetical protein ACRDAU_16400 [Clostridium sp.]